MKLINFRIDSNLREKLHTLKQTLFPHDNLSDVARNYLSVGLDKGVQCVPRPFEPNIVVIASKIINQVSLSLSELKCLAWMSHSAYACSLSNTFIRKELIIAQLSAFKAVFNIANVASDKLNYYRGNLGVSGSDIDIITATNKMITRIKEADYEKGIPCCEILARSLEGIMNFDLGQINILRLNQVLKPYLPDLLKLAKYYHRKSKDGQPAFHVLDNYAFNYQFFGNNGTLDNLEKVSETFKRGNFRLRINKNIDFTCVLYGKQDDYCLQFNFDVFDQFSRLLGQVNDLTFKGISLKVDNVFLTRRFEDCAVMVGIDNYQFFVSEQDYCDLQALFSKANEAHRQSINELECQWGVI